MSKFGNRLPRVRPAVGAGVNDKSANAAGLRVIGAADALSHRGEA
jgi:hypothetical protein